MGKEDLKDSRAEGLCLHQNLFPWNYCTHVAFPVQEAAHRGLPSLQMKAPTPRSSPSLPSLPALASCCYSSASNKLFPPAKKKTKTKQKTPGLKSASEKNNPGQHPES